MDTISDTDTVLERWHHDLAMGTQDEAATRALLLPLVTFRRSGLTGIVEVYGSRVQPSVKSALDYAKATHSRIRNLLRERKNAAARDKIVEARARFADLFDAAKLDTGY